MADIRDTKKESEINDRFIREFENRSRHIFQAFWLNCSEVEQTLLMLIALSNSNGRLHKNKQFNLSGIDLIFTQRERELKNLEEQGIVIRKTSREPQGLQNLYSFTSSIMERFVIQEIWNTENANIQNRQKVFLKLMSHEQVNKVTKSIEWIGEHQKEIMSAFEVSSKLLGG